MTSLGPDIVRNLLARGLVGEMPAAAIGAAIGVEVARPMALAVANREFGLAFARIALLAFARLVAELGFALLRRLLAAGVLAFERARKLIAEARFEGAALRLERRFLVASHLHLLWDNLLRTRALSHFEDSRVRAHSPTGLSLNMYICKGM